MKIADAGNKFHVQDGHNELLSGRGRTPSLRRDNRGAGIILVIVAMAFIGVLVAILMYTSLMNYRMKTTNLRSSSAEYSAETAMDEIKAGIQRDVSAAMRTAYMQVMMNYESYGDVADVATKNRATDFNDIYFKSLRENLGRSSTTYDVTKLSRYLTYPKNHTVTGAATDTTGAEVVTAPSDAIMVVTKKTMTLKNIKVTYTDTAGYTSDVKADITVDLPDLSFNQKFLLSELAKYAIVGQQSVVVESGKSTINGSLYGGLAPLEERKLAGRDYGILVSAGTGNELSLKNAEIVGTDSTLLVANGATLSVEKSSLWANNVNVDSATVKTDEYSVMHVANDLEVLGRDSKLTLGGEYYGFGNQTTDDENAATGTSNQVVPMAAPAKGSSAILINGRDTILDFTTLNRLVIGGNAYIGTSRIAKSKVNEPTTGKDVNPLVLNSANKGVTPYTGDITMGGAVATKADQIAFLVPAECIGWASGRTLLGANPVPYSDYQKFISRYITGGKNKNVLGKVVNMVVNTDALVNELGGKTLKEYGAGYTTVIRQTEGGNPWIYFYLTFDKTENATKFFRDYFSVNTNTGDSQSKLERYIGYYVKNMKLNPALYTQDGSGVITSEGRVVTNSLNDMSEDTVFRLNIAGNMIMCDPGLANEDSSNAKMRYYLVPETTMTDAQGEELAKEFADSQNVYQSICKTLSVQYKSKTTEELSDEQNVYTNYVAVKDTTTTEGTIGINAFKNEYLSNGGTMVATGGSGSVKDTIILSDGTTSAAVVYLNGQGGENTVKLSSILSKITDRSKLGLVVVYGMNDFNAGREEGAAGDGNLIVDKTTDSNGASFEGTLIASGKITVQNGCDVNYSAKNVSNAVGLTYVNAKGTPDNTEDDVTLRLAAIFVGGPAIIEDRSGEEGDAVVTADSLVHYHNWEKE